MPQHDLRAPTVERLEEKAALLKFVRELEPIRNQLISVGCHNEAAMVDAQIARIRAEAEK